MPSVRLVGRLFPALADHPRTGAGQRSPERQARPGEAAGGGVIRARPISADQGGAKYQMEKL